MVPHRQDSASGLPAPHFDQGFPRLAPAAQPPCISVLVPVRNEAAFIVDTVRQLLDQDYDRDRFEVIVADGGSTDDTCALVRGLQRTYPNLQLVDNPGRWSSAGRNAALEVARGDLVVVVDGHCDVSNPRHLAELADAFVRSGADCVGRPQPLDVSQATTLQRAIALARSSRLGHHPESFIYSGAEQFVRPQSVAVAYRREVFGAVGAFDETFDACEDVEFNHRVDRAGLRCFFTPRVAVHYHPRATLRGLFRQMSRYGRGRVRLLRKHPDTFTAPGFVPAVFLLGLLVGPLLACLSSWLALAFLAGLGLYGLAVLAASVSIACRARDWRLAPLCPLVFLAIHAGAGAGIWLELLRPGRRPAPAPAVASQLTPAARKAA